MFPLSVWLKIAKQSPKTWTLLCESIPILGRHSLNIDIQKLISKLFRDDVPSRMLMISQKWGPLDLLCFCPHCFKQMDDSGLSGLDDYSKQNVWVYCSDCGVFLLCLSNIRGKRALKKYETRPTCLSVEKIVENEEFSSECVSEISREDAFRYAEKHSFKIDLSSINGEHNDDDEHNEHASKFYMVGVLMLTHLSKKKDRKKRQKLDFVEDSSTNRQMNYSVLNPPITILRDAEKQKIDCSHDGVYLWYKGYCKCCRNPMQGKIWGD